MCDLLLVIGARSLPDSLRGDGKERDLALLSTTPSEMLVQDQYRLNQVGITFRVLDNPTLEELDRELFNQRIENGAACVQFSAHMDAQKGILLANGWAAPQWLQLRLKRNPPIQVLALMGCTSDAIADWFIGLVDFVIAVNIKLDNTIASRWQWEFWLRMVDDADPKAAYKAACDLVPGTEQFIALRYRRNRAAAMPEQKQNPDRLQQIEAIMGDMQRAFEDAGGARGLARKVMRHDQVLEGDTGLAIVGLRAQIAELHDQLVRRDATLAQQIKEQAAAQLRSFIFSNLIFAAIIIVAFVVARR